MQTVLGFFHTVQMAGNGMEGLEQLDRFAPDFVICDINMPVMNGLETVEAIRRHPLMCRVPVFFLTAESDSSLPRKAFDLGANLYLRKPLDPLRLLKNIDYFLKETGLWPGSRAPGPASPPPGPKSAAAAPAAGGPLRILTVDFNIENQRLLRELLEGGPDAPALAGGPFETLWTEDSRHALGNLVRWEPDLILYNPRNPGLDGVAFGQTLLLQKLSGVQQIAFIGTRFYEIDFKYSRQHFQREVIDLDAARATIAHLVGAAVKAARARLRPKRFTFEQIKAEEIERLRQRQATSARHAREREVLRQRYSGIQDFIDKQF
jgi:CheY-like chemotaxis protein